LAGLEASRRQVTVVSSTVLTLAVISAIYALLKPWRLARGWRGDGLVLSVFI